MIITVGEVVWDIFQDKKVLGGAPVNVAYHLGALGNEVRVITRVGRDELGDEAIKRMGELGVVLDGVQVGEPPTGSVVVTLDARQEPHFDIGTPAAWDEIDVDQALAVVASGPFSLVYGTLAQRDARSRKTIRALWEKADFRIYDVNLRQPFTTKKLVLESLRAADMVKLNLEELFVLAGWTTLFADTKEDMARELMDFKTLTAVVVTEGKNGAFVATADGVFHDRGEAVSVVDPVGAGDAFLAGLINGYHRKLPWPECLARANRLGGYVASQPGATPAMPENL